MSILDNIKRIESGLQAVANRYTNTYTCVICGKTGVTYQTALTLASFVPNSQGVGVPASLIKAMIVCGEDCRKKYVFDGRVPYAWLMEGVGIPKRFFGKFSELLGGEKQSKTCVKWLDKLDSSIYISGITGTGKTTLATTLAYELRKREFRVKFCRSSDLTIRANTIFKQTELKEFVAELYSYDVLIIDDITKHNLTINGKECIFNIYNGFYEDNKPVIFTSNYRIGDVAQHIDERLGSRVVEMCVEVFLAGKDKRLNGQNKNPGEC